jgi:hypothetical protein
MQIVRGLLYKTDKELSFICQKMLPQVGLFGPANSHVGEKMGCIRLLFSEFWSLDAAVWPGSPIVKFFLFHFSMWKMWKNATQYHLFV